jgi:hypothetical protein
MTSNGRKGGRVRGGGGEWGVHHFRGGSTLDNTGVFGLERDVHGCFLGGGDGEVCLRAREDVIGEVNQASRGPNRALTIPDTKGC